MVERAVRENELQKLAARYRELMRRVRENVAHWEGRGTVAERWTAPSAIFSDTIVVWADLQMVRMDMFMHFCGVLMATALEMRFPLRGGVALGQCIMDAGAGVYIGTALVNANRVEKGQEWVGVGIHSSCYEAPVHGVPFGADVPVVEYEVPRKPGVSPVTRALAWHPYYCDGVPACAKRLSDLKADSPEAVWHKYDNALRFIENVTWPSSQQPTCGVTHSAEE